jgi:hypothetical protein
MGERSDLPERSQLIEGLAGSPSLLSRLGALLDRLDALPPALRGLIRAALESRLDGDLLEFLADYLDEHGLADGHKVRLLRPVPGDLLLLWHRTHYTSDENRQAMAALAEQVAQMLADDHDVHWVTLPAPELDFRLLDPEQLRAAGWVREEEAARRVRDEADACARLAEQVADEYYAREGRLSSPAGFAAEEIAGAIRSRLGG